MPLSALSMVMLMIATLYGMTGHCSSDHKILIACGLYTLAGLCLASGLFVFVSVLSDAYTEHPLTYPSHFHYYYGWSFFTAGVSFIMAEVAALLSISSYLKRFPTAEDMARIMVPGTDRRLQQLQQCKDLLINRSILGPDMLQKTDVVDGSAQEGSDGTLLTSRTPPDICPIPIEESFHPVPTTVPITLMHQRPPAQISTFQLHPDTFSRYSTLGRSGLIHDGVLEALQGTTSSSGSSSSSAAAVTSSSSSYSTTGRRHTQSLARKGRHSGYRSGSPSSLSQGYCSGQQHIIILSDEEIV